MSIHIVASGVCPVGSMPASSCWLWSETALLRDGWASSVRLRLCDGLIAELQRGVEPRPGDERHGIALPGLANVHSHAFQRAMAGLTELRHDGKDDFWSWRELMYRFVARLQPEDLEAIAAQAFADMLEGGFTRVGEFHYLHHAPDGSRYAQPAEMSERIVAAARTSGIGLTLMPVLYAHGGFGGRAPTEGQRRFVTQIDEYADLYAAARAAVMELPDGRSGIAPHSLRAVTPEQLRVVTQIDAHVPVHLHVAEQQAEVADCLAWSGQRPVQWLLDHVDLGPRWCLVHATHIDGDELPALAASGAVVGLCPVTESNLGDGIFPARAWLEADGRLAIGTDSNVSIAAADELRLLEYGQRLHLRRRALLGSPTRASTGARLYSAALAGGTQALAAPAAGLAEGAAADIVSLDATHPSLIGRGGDTLLDSWVFAATRDAIDCVWRLGRKVVSGGRHVGRAAISARYRRSLTALLA
jgi:formimidoylglutamate deiminase